MSEFAVKGLKDVLATLEALPQRLQTQAIRSGLTAAAAVVRDEARLRAPKRTGKMARSIRSGSPRRQQDGNFSISVSLKGDHAFLGFFHEYGVSPHFIKPGDSGKSAKLLTRAAKRGDVTGDVSTRKLKIGNQFISGTVMHPGHGARPFLRPALDTKAQEAILAFRDKIIAVVEKKTGYNMAVTFDEAA